MKMAKNGIKKIIAKMYLKTLFSIEIDLPF